jgi:hypothetical protein
MSTWRRRWTGRQKAATSRRWRYPVGGIYIVEEDEESRRWNERMDEGWRSGQSDLNELDVLEWAELALDKVE